MKRKYLDLTDQGSEDFARDSLISCRVDEDYKAAYKVGNTEFANLATMKKELQVGAVLKMKTSLNGPEFLAIVTEVKPNSFTFLKELTGDDIYYHQSAENVDPENYDFYRLGHLELEFEDKNYYFVNSSWDWGKAKYYSFDGDTVNLISHVETDQYGARIPYPYDGNLEDIKEQNYVYGFIQVLSNPVSNQDRIRKPVLR